MAAALAEIDGVGVERRTHAAAGRCRPSLSLRRRRPPLPFTPAAHPAALHRTSSPSPTSLISEMFGDAAVGFSEHKDGQIVVESMLLGRLTQVHLQAAEGHGLCSVPRWEFSGGASPPGLPRGRLYGTASRSSCLLGADDDEELYAS